MTTLNCRKYEDIYKGESHNRKINLNNLEFGAKKHKFLTVLKEFEETKNNFLIKDIIIYGRNLSDAYLQLYISGSETCCLYRILEINDSFGSFYGYDVVVNNDYFIRDKCKYYSTKIFVLFFLQHMSSIKCELMNYHNHLWNNRIKLNDKFDYYYKRMNLIYHSLIYTEIGVHKSLANIDFRIDYQRLENINELSRSRSSHLLQRAVIVGSCAGQPSYRGFTADMLRMWIALEYKPNPAPDHKLGGDHTIPKNCRKWTFCYESIFDVSITINDATHNMSKRGIFLLYVSADRFHLDQSHNINSTIIMNNRFGLKMKQSPDPKVKHPDEECMLPIDIQSFIVVPTVLIIDSSVSSHFLQIKDQTKLPILCLLSPDLLPNQFVKHEMKIGKLFTLFLTCPIIAFVIICGHLDTNVQTFKELERIFTRFANAVESDLWRISDEKLRLFMGDPFCRSLIVRYLFCNISLRLHCEFPVDGYLPKCNLIEVESTIVNDKRFQNFIYSMATVVNSSGKFASASDLNSSINVED